MLKRLFLTSFLSLSLAGCASKIVQQPEETGTGISFSGDIRLLAQLPDAVVETSGLAQKGNLIWTLNDSGDGPVLYALNAQFKIEKQVKVAGAENIDWEDLAQDDEYLYIADCGNNRGNRRKLQIYKVRWQDLTAGQSEVAAEIITFKYADRTDYLPTKEHNYDCEALAAVGDELWLFTKNRQNEKTHLYRLNKSSPFQQVLPSGSYDVRGLITAADYDPELKLLVLLGYEKNLIFGSSFIWTLPVAEQKPVWKHAQYTQLTPYAQWEAVLWGRRSILLTTEKSPLLDVSVGVIEVTRAETLSGSEK